MALSFALKEGTPIVIGDRRLALCDITFDNSYPTGGEAVTAANFGLSRLDRVVPHPHASRIGTWDDTNAKILLNTALGTEAGNGSDQSSIVLSVTAYGK